MKLFKYIKANQFFPAYAPHIGSWKHKLNGSDGRRKFAFTEADRKAIQAGLKKMIREGKV